jgi:hypothetical protein
MTGYYVVFMGPPEEMLTRLPVIWNLLWTRAFWSATA